MLLIIALTFWHFKNNSTHSTARYYAEQLGNLTDNIQSINSLIKDENYRNPSLKNIDNYHNALVGVLDTCRQMNGRYNRTKDDVAIKHLRDRMDQVSKLCADLEKVTDYARKQSEAIQDFVLFPSASLTSQENLPKFHKILNKARSDLETLKQDPINDPAVPELLTLVDQMVEHTKDGSVNPNDLNTLTNEVQTHQTNFLNARTYYWRNTIGIDALERAIIRLETQFKQ